MRRPRPIVAALALAAVPAFLVLDTTLAWDAGWRPRNVVPFLIVGVAGALLLAIAVLLARTGGRAWLAARSGKLLALVSALAIAWTIAEVALALTFGNRLLFHHYPPGLQRVLRPREDVMRGVHGPARVSFNSLGVRGPELPADRAARRILCVGGSTTLCLYLDDDETWPALVARTLAEHGQPCWVGNLGQNAFATRHHVRFTRTSPLLRAVDDVVFLIGFNDFIKALVGGPVAGGGGVTPLWLRSPLVTAMQNIYLVHRSRALLQDDVTGGVYMTRREIRRRAQVVETLPELAPHLAAYKQNVADMVAHVRAAGARPLLAANPAKWRADGALSGDDLWFGHVGDDKVLEPRALRAGLDLFTRALREVAAELDVPFVDLSALDGDDDALFDDCHFTESGARAVAVRVADALTASGR